MNVELPPLPEPVRTSSDQAYLGYTADQMREYGRACARAAYAKAEAELRAISTGFDAAGGDVAAASASFCAAVVCALGERHDKRP